MGEIRLVCVILPRKDAVRLFYDPDLLLFPEPSIVANSLPDHTLKLEQYLCSQLESRRQSYNRFNSSFRKF